ncbi:hypothetical protein Sjap_017984 [Stephania japonica]|uniref:NAC domain-containing protein n=1 Tax=Stephania japonica TaxID=461633 RepID=A0AAP0I784_9MAGN
MELESCVPPGFRFHPTEEELVGYYLKRKLNSEKIDLDVIVDIDLYRIEPWDIQDRCNLGYEEQSEWYFFSHKDKKYPTGTRTNRATAAGFWKATGRDKAVLSKHKIIGMRKTLVFYKGRAPNGNKTDWIMHEYRLQTSEYGPPEASDHIDEGWVVCRAFKKPSPSHRQGLEAWNRACYVRELDYHRQQAISSNNSSTSHNVDPNYNQVLNHHQSNFAFELPQLESPSMTTSASTTHGIEPAGSTINDNYADESNNYPQLVDWRAMDRLLSSQLNEAGTSNQNTTVPLIPDCSVLDAHNQSSFSSTGFLMCK